MDAAHLPPVVAVGFDLGETLYHYGDTPLGWLEALRPGLEAVATTLGLGDDADIDGATAVVAELDSGDGPGLAECDICDVMVQILQRMGGDAGEHVEAAVDAFFGYVRKDLVAYPDAARVLRELKSRGYRVGALTNVPYGMPHHVIQEDLEQTGLAPLLDAMVTSADVGERKPSPQPYRWLAGMLGVDTTQMAYVGNKDTDMEGALSVGAVGVLIDRVYKPSDYGQTATVAELSGLLDLLPAIGQARV
jgi:putative hydrolase of the HAD superfamily